MRRASNGIVGTLSPAPRPLLCRRRPRHCLCFKFLQTVVEIGLIGGSSAVAVDAAARRHYNQHSIHRLLHCLFARVRSVGSIKFVIWCRFGLVAVCVQKPFIVLSTSFGGMLAFLLGNAITACMFFNFSQESTILHRRTLAR